MVASFGGFGVGFISACGEVVGFVIWLLVGSDYAQGVLCYCVRCVVGGLWCEGFVAWLLAGYVALPTYGWIWDWCGGLLGV